MFLGNLHDFTPTDQLYLSNQVARLERLLGTDHPDVQRIKAGFHTSLAGICERRGLLDEALAHLEEAYRICENLFGQDGASSSRKDGLATSLLHLGDVRHGKGQTAAALECYERAATLFKELITDNSSNLYWRSQLALCLHGFAACQREPAKALRFYRECCEIQQQLVGHEPDNAEYLGELAQTYNNIGGELQRLGQQREALEFLKKGCAIRERLVARTPNNRDCQYALALSLLGIARILRATDQTAALDFSERARRHAHNANGADPSNPRHALLAIDCCVTVGRLKLNTDEAAALRCFEEGRQIAEKVLETNQGDPGLLSLLVQCHAKTVSLKAGSGDIDFTEVASRANTFAEQYRGLRLVQYNAACMLSLACGAALRNGQSELAEQYAAGAIQLLARAQATGYFRLKAHVEHMKKDTDLAPLRARPDFQEWLIGLEQAG